MVTAGIVQLGVDAEEPFAGAELQGRTHRDRRGVVSTPGARALVAERVRRPLVRRVDSHAGAHGTGLECGDLDVLGPVDDEVLGGRGVVVGVAAVAAVHQSSEAAHREPVGGRDGVRALAVDLDVEMLVVERRRP